MAEQIIALRTLGNVSHNTSSDLDSGDEGDALVKEQQTYNVWDEIWE